MAENFHIIDASTTVGIHPKHRLDMSVERLVTEMDKFNITSSLSISTIAIFHQSEAGNAVTLDSVKESSRLVPMGTVNPRNYFGRAENMQAIRAQGFRIFKFFPVEQGWVINSTAFGEVLRQLAAFKTPLMINAGRPGDATAIAGMTSQYPAPVVLCSVSLDTLSEAITLMSRLPNLMVETHELHVPGGLELIADRIGADRIVFGSGAPLRSTASSLYYVLDSGLSDSDKQKVLGGNIKRILEAG